MKTSNAKKLKYLDVQFITIKPIESRGANTVNGNRKSRVIPEIEAEAPKLQPYPGFSNCNGLFTKDEISEIDHSLLYSEGTGQFRIQPTSKLSFLRQSAENAIHTQGLTISEDSNHTTEPPSCKETSNVLSRCDSLISNHSLTDLKENNQISSSASSSEKNGKSTYFDEQRNENNDIVQITPTEIQNQVWIYAHHEVPQQKSGEKAILLNGSLDNGVSNISLNKGQKRLKNIIASSAPKEFITPDFDTPSILNKSYCARRIYKYLVNTAIPLPTFLQDDESNKNDSKHNE
ncbi:hypothetical protein TRFO_33102 [Tritrichomonas foetus]|uniref:Uncharacterized protein n=1 Tax=Tritrichomonas foetus TaxID=1144522 RepID=A0A1J4JMA4_9EUKA|nr:hypothetical protein TRFO_33102 [Tritrichomonas foetus]|eukprot:OHT00231.1 hypothetical protein TRFO_33102 [Tritrichomonas foetus]